MQYFVLIECFIAFLKRKITNLLKLSHLNTTSIIFNTKSNGVG